VWYVVPQLILLGNLFFPILVYGYFVTASDAHASGAARLLAEMAALVLVILPPLGPLAGCFLGLGSGLGLVGTASSRR